MCMVMCVYGWARVPSLIYVGSGDPNAGPHVVV